MQWVFCFGLLTFITISPTLLCMSNEQIPVAVIGCGRMGKLHARVYSQMPQVKLVGVYDANFDAADAAASQYGTVAYKTIEELVHQVKAVTIATPTTFHYASAESFIRNGVACLIEKPLAKDSIEARKIVDLAKKHNSVVQVGHIERFNPVVRAMSEINIAPRFMEVTRVSPFSFRSIDVGVVLDMMIHDIDIVLRLARSTVKSVSAVGVSVVGETEDICNARVEFENGCVANITASRLALKTERKLRAFAEDAYVSIDYQKKYGIVVRKGENVQQLRDVMQKVKAGEIDDLSQINYTELVDIQELQIDDVEPLRAQLDAFIDAANRKSQPVVSAEDGLAAVMLAERIVAAMPNPKV